MVEPAIVPGISVAAWLLLVLLAPFASSLPVDPTLMAETRETTGRARQGLEQTLRDLARKFLNRPEVFFTKDEGNANVLLGITKRLYDFSKAMDSDCVGKHYFSILPELYTDGLDLEQIWEELQLQNRPSIEFLRKRCSAIAEAAQELSAGLNEESEGSDDSSVEKSTASGGAKDDSSKEGSGMDDEDDDVFGDAANEESGEELSRVQRESELSVQEKIAAVLQENNLSSDAQERKKSGDQIVEEPTSASFFNEADYEAFADGKEDLGHLMNVVVEGYDNLEEIDEDETGDGEDSQGEVLQYRLDSDDESRENNSKKLKSHGSEYKYSDFFDVRASSSGVRAGSVHGFAEGSEESARPGNGDSEDETGVGEENSGKDSRSDDESDDDEDEPLSRHEEFQRQMRQTIRELEAENLKQRSWELQGEVTATARPKDSLMEAEIEYQRNTKVAPEITPDVTESLEEMIKQRIRDELWDDVERRTEIVVRKEKELSEVSTEKSKIGLGEVYAQDFEQRFLGAAASGEEEKKKQELQLMQLWKALCHKLDSLSNFHFTPKPVVRDMEVRPNVAAINMEEVIPMGVSSSSAVAPEEVKAKARGRAGVLKSAEELTPEQRQQQRRAKKAARRKARRAKRADEKAVARANPGMGNKYAKQKLLEELGRARNVKDAAVDKAGVRWTKSSDVFRKLQDEQTGAVSTGQGAAKKKRKMGSHSASLKL